MKSMSLSGLREHLGLSQGQVARAADSNQPAIRKTESSTDPRLSTLRRYTAALGAAAGRAVTLNVTIAIDDTTYQLSFPTDEETPVPTAITTPTSWRLRAWDDPALEQRWLDENVIAISDDEIGDLTDWPGDDELRRRLADAFTERGDPRSEQAYGTFVRYWRSFRLDMRPGDTVVVPLVGQRVGIADITGDYEYRAHEDDHKMRHTRPVRWTRTTDRAALDDNLRKVVNAPGTICRVRSVTTPSI